MPPIQVKLTVEELELLTTLASDQLFRREFIDSKLPGSRVNHTELSQAKSLVSRLRLILDPRSAKRPLSASVLSKKRAAHAL